MQQEMVSDMKSRQSINSLFPMYAIKTNINNDNQNNNYNTSNNYINSNGSYNGNIIAQLNYQNLINNDTNINYSNNNFDNNKNIYNQTNNPVQSIKDHSLHSPCTMKEEKSSKSNPAHITAAKEKRKEKNKILARKTRVKKKYELEMLREQAATLFHENEILKKMITTLMPAPVSAAIMINYDVQIPDNIASVVNTLLSNLAQDKMKFIQKSVVTMQKCFCITNACAFDCPIVYASPGFLELTGYPVSEVLGRNCRFLQGPDTDQKEVCRLYQ
jgi:hypothetical protein